MAIKDQPISEVEWIPIEKVHANDYNPNSVDSRNVCVIMEYSAKNVSEEDALNTLREMIAEAFEVRGWELDNMVCESAFAKVEEENTKYTTFACIAEW